MTFVTVVALVLAPVSTAFADPNAGPGVEEMNRLNNEGFKAFKEQRYVVAAQDFRAAYKAHPDPNLRKNEAIAWFKAGKCKEAVPAANAFLIAQNTSLSDQKEARSVLANCKVHMAREAINTGDFSLASQLLDEAESLKPDQYASDQIALARVDLDKKRHGQASQAQTNPWGWVLVGTGGAIIGGAVAYWLLTIHDRKQSQTITKRDPSYDSVTRRAKTSRWLAPTLLLGGAAITGVGIYFVFGKSNSQDAGPSKVAYLGVSGTF